MTSKPRFFDEIYNRVDAGNLDLEASAPTLSSSLFIQSSPLPPPTTL